MAEEGPAQFLLRERQPREPGIGPNGPRASSTLGTGFWVISLMLAVTLDGTLTDTLPTWAPSQRAAVIAPSGAPRPLRAAAGAARAVGARRRRPNSRCGPAIPS